ncbi:MAG: ABC transporter permease [Bacteroidales bacterium]|nr:ABC transporter permease [Bacteroidales bacterium]
MKRILSVLRRELGIWRKRPVYLIGSICVMVICSVFYLTFLKDGVPSDLPIGVVDYDGSSLSRNFIQQLDATQLGEVRQYPDFETARDDMERGKITSICVLPENMYADVMAQRQPEFTFYVNTLYFLGGSLAYKDILTMINLTSGAVQRQTLRMKGVNEHAIMGQLRPVDIDIHMPGNPTMNYGAYLANMMLPGVLEMIIIILIIYSLGTELKYGTSRHLLTCTDGRIIPALGGKMLLYTILFTAMGFSLMLLLYGWMHFPLAGSIWWMLLDVLLLVLASEAIGVFIIGCVPVLRFALSIGALFSVMAFSMTGFTLPVEAMPAGIQGLAEIFPLRHYYQMYVQGGMFGTGFAGCYKEIIHLLLFQFLPLTVLLRLKKAYILQNYPKK